ncbi:MAG: hypothetical protein A3F54_03020 [Candidatus Kerfeldbacteria bacterium RIFCSPHIGHO2_12_FULL_48_17]|uniref:Glucose/Sorbosone dehydrogenase domain-containing protein n=1 Tax=Candidatus Kerfeldbacteria bacterium RIFCSPHIGHO2_12_FULL_48_17 TaxID=1798542 RepID=A0A1G2B818_9BACT|nr:MAG: hypothetical protein A3F54_03020 [Candidatus Kerfeldbacteria bacterium RIFCSPHIGHO2_12_FULL_48_17]
MKRTHTFITIIILLGAALVSFPTPSSSNTVPQTTALAAATDTKKSALSPVERLPRIRYRNLKYQGAFRVPGDTINGTSFNYGGTAIAYNPDKNSLYMVGHDHHQKVAEIKIPQIVNGTSLTDLKTATFLQKFYDFSDGKVTEAGDYHTKVGGLLVYKNRLYGTAYEYYDANNSQILSHIISPLDISRPRDARGPYQVGTAGAGFVSGFMTQIPPVWQKLMGGPALTGQCCLAIVGRTSSGPAASVFDPTDLGKLEKPVPATQVVGYPLAHPLGTGWGTTSNLFNGTTVMAGAVWPEGTRSVLFFGRQGIGPWCYGTGAECNDPVVSYKGTHAYPYVYQIWAYDARDFVSVKNGEKQPWEIKPHDIWRLELPFADQNHVIGGVTYDTKNRRIFVSQLRGDNKLPVVHVFTIGGPLK